MKILHGVGADLNCLHYLMQTIYCDHSTHKRYWISDYSLKAIGLPPLAEQRRIVAAIETAFEQLDYIAAELA
jgi:type I restriction enzyme S subunit